MLSKQNESFQGDTEVITFSKPAYVSWETSKSPGLGWFSKGIQSVFYADGGREGIRIRYKQDSIVTPLEIGTIRKRRAYRFATSYDGLELGVYHLVMPSLCLPDPRSFRTESKPLYRRKTDDKIAMTWTFQERIAVEFVFTEADRNEFLHFPTSSTPEHLRIDPGLRAELQKPLDKAKEESENLLTNVIVEFLKNSS